MRKPRTKTGKRVPLNYPDPCRYGGVTFWVGVKELWVSRRVSMYVMV